MSKLNHAVTAYLKKLKNHDDSCFQKLFDCTYNHLIGVAKFYLNDKYYAEDVVNEAFLATHKYINSFDENKDGYNWLCKIVERKAYDYNESHNNEQPINDSFAKSEDFDAIDETLDLQRILNNLDPIDFQIIQLKFFHGLTPHEIAQKLRMRPSFVKYKIKLILNDVKKNF